MDDAADDELLPSLQSLFESNVDTICPFGDIVIVVEDDFLPTAKFRVSSCILAMSSSVFTALFSKNFSEGQSMCSREPGQLIEIQIIDSPLAMKRFLRLLHHAHPLEYWEDMLSTSALLDLAIIIDKYDCIEALRLPTDSLLANYVGNENYKLDHLLTASHMFDQPAHFRYFAKQLVSTEREIQAENFDEKCLELLPPTLLHSLTCQQGIARQAITTRITCFIEKFTKACKAAGRASLVVELLDELKARGLWPIHFDYSIRTLCGRVEEISIPFISPVNTNDMHTLRGTGSLSPIGEPGDHSRWPENSRGHINDGWGDAAMLLDSDAPVHHDLKRMSDSIQQLVVGVCLDCIQGWDCRMRHWYHWSDSAPRMELSKSYEDSDGQSVYSMQAANDLDFDVQVGTNERPGHWEDIW